MSSSNDDARMLLATQIAYLDADPGVTVQEAINESIQAFYEAGCPSEGLEHDRFETAKNLSARMMEFDMTEECGNWVIVDTCDENDTSGFFACLIDTNEGNAIVGFRGSESWDGFPSFASDSQFMKDWVQADLGLLNSIQTEQQASAEAYVNKINVRYGNRYESFDFTGHSLGGSNAQHAYLTAPDGMPLGRCLNLDGPGNSDEYISFYGERIQERGMNIDHFVYSWVGSLLTPVPGCNYSVILAHNDGDHRFPISLFYKHDTRNIEMQGYSFQPGESDILMNNLSPLSKMIDDDEGAPNFLYLFGAKCPFVAFVALVWDVIYDISIGKNPLSDAWDWLVAAWNGITDFFSMLFADAMTGEYTMRCEAVDEMGGEFEVIGTKVAAVSNEVYSIAADLSYNSISGSLFRAALFRSATNISTCAEKSKAFSTAARSCARYVRSYDKSAAGCYA